MNWYGFAAGFITVLALMMFWEVVALAALSFILLQATDWLETGKWTVCNLVSELDNHANFQPTHWKMINEAIHYVLFDAEAAVVLFVAATAVAPIKLWLEGSSKPSEMPPSASNPSGIMPGD